MINHSIYYYCIMIVHGWTDDEIIITWRWLFTSSLVNPSTFISSRICFGVATFANKKQVLFVFSSCTHALCIFSTQLGLFDSSLK